MQVAQTSAAAPSTQPVVSPQAAPAPMGAPPQDNAYTRASDQSDSAHSVATGLFSRRRNAEADAELARTELGRVTGELSVLRLENAALKDEKESVARELARVRGMEPDELAAEIRKLREDLAALDAQLEERRSAQVAEAARQEAELSASLDRLRQQAEQDTRSAQERRDAALAEAARADERLRGIRQNIVVTEDTALLQEVGIYSYHHVLEDAVAYKSALADLADSMKATVAKGQAVQGKTNWTVNGSASQGRKMVSDFSKLMLRAYNAEADYAVRSMRPHRLHSLVDRLDKSRATIAKLGATMDIRITDTYHRLRVRELELTADFLSKQEEEKERRRELREIQREDEKLQREIERERARLAKERQQYLGALARMQESATAGGQGANGSTELSAKLAEIDAALAAVDAREANIRAGYVYVISNIGAFGGDVVKIGLTRRLEPMERINELGDASVPFRFDVHALIFSEDAVGLERNLHKEFEPRRVNRVNHRREFFRTTPGEVRDALTRFGGQHLLEFHEEAEALEWRASAKPKEVAVK
ncbi:MAG TPA: DUF4041 domain-containing protein [Actinocrinis sp.]